MKTLAAVTMAALLLAGSVSLALADGDCAGKAATKTADAGTSQDAKKGS